MTHVFHRQTKSVPPVATRGDGVYIVDKSGKRGGGLKALANLREHVQKELGRQGPLGVRSWDLSYYKTPKQPGGVSCGVCVVMMIELMVTEGVEAFYQLNEQCKARETNGPLPEGATEVHSGKVHGTTRYINTKRLEYACLIANQNETAEFAVARNLDHETITDLLK